MDGCLCSRRGVRVCVSVCWGSLPRSPLVCARARVHACVASERASVDREHGGNEGCLTRMDGICRDVTCIPNRPVKFSSVLFCPVQSCPVQLSSGQFCLVQFCAGLYKLFSPISHSESCAQVTERPFIFLFCFGACCDSWQSASIQAAACYPTPSSGAGRCGWVGVG